MRSCPRRPTCSPLSSATLSISPEEFEHPGSLIPERSYLRSALEDMKDEILAALADAAAEAWEGA